MNVGNQFTAFLYEILKLVDSDNPPLRLILGTLLPMVKQVYAQRIATWEEWDDVARAAKGA